MGIPIRKIVEMAGGVAGLQLGNHELVKIEKEENKLLAGILMQQQLTNAILLKILEDAIGEDAAQEFAKEIS